MSSNIFKVTDFLPRSHREKKLNQHSRVIWFTGLSGSGKTTLARALEKALADNGHLVYVLDGDNIRYGLNKDLGFDEPDRIENIRRIAEVSKLFADAGVITMNCFVSPTRTMRAMAESIIGKKDFIEVYVECPLEVFENRDVKGLYAKARRGEIADFTGITSPYEEPIQADIVIHTATTELDVCVVQLLQHLEPKLRNHNIDI